MPTAVGEENSQSANGRSSAGFVRWESSMPLMKACDADRRRGNLDFAKQDTVKGRPILGRLIFAIPRNHSEVRRII